MSKPKIAWSKKVSPSFIQILLAGCSAMRWGPDGPSNLMACMAWESGETFSPSVKNPYSSATGLIQFMAATARALGTTTQALAAMSAEEQLKWVFKYLDQFPTLKGPHIKLADIYMAILMPKYISAPLTQVVIADPRQYAVNAGLDVNKDRMITKAEAAAKVYAKLEKGLTDAYSH